MHDKGSNAAELPFFFEDFGLFMWSLKFTPYRKNKLGRMVNPNEVMTPERLTVIGPIRALGFTKLTILSWMDTDYWAGNVSASRTSKAGCLQEASTSED